MYKEYINFSKSELESLSKKFKGSEEKQFCPICDYASKLYNVKRHLKAIHFVPENFKFWTKPTLTKEEKEKRKSVLNQIYYRKKKKLN